MASFDLNDLKKSQADLFQNYIGGEIAAPLFLAIGPILLSHWLEQKTDQKTSAAMSFLLISLYFKQKVLVVKISINFSWISNHFDMYIICLCSCSEQKDHQFLFGSST